MVRVPRPEISVYGYALVHAYGVHLTHGYYAFTAPYAVESYDPKIPMVFAANEPAKPPAP